MNTTQQNGTTIDANGTGANTGITIADVATDTTTTSRPATPSEPTTGAADATASRQQPRLEIHDGSVSVENGMNERKTILSGVNLTVHDGEFVTVLGGNGAGKSTLFNVITGTLPLSHGHVLLNGEDVTGKGETKRAKSIARVFQDPKMGTAPRMTVAENLLLALRRGEKRRLRMRPMAANTERFRKLCALIGNGLQEHLDDPTGDLSGGQRQALSLLMATITKPDLLLLDEHTAALDPKTSKQLMAVTDDQIRSNHLTCLMITHRMDDALKYGNRLIVLQKGRITHDYNAEEKRNLTMPDLLRFFEEGELG